MIVPVSRLEDDCRNLTPPPMFTVLGCEVVEPAATALMDPVVVVPDD